MQRNVKYVQSLCACGREIVNTAITIGANGYEAVAIPAPAKCRACIGNPREQIIERRALNNMRAAVINALHSKGNYRLQICNRA